MSKKNTTQIGDELRNKVYDLLDACGKQKLYKEFKVLGKKADIYYEEPRPFGATCRIAVESKHYSKALGISQLSGIIKDYEPAQEKDFDILVILSREGLTSDAISRAKSYCWIFIRTFEDFYYTIIDFRNYVNHIDGVFNNQGLDKYYINPKDIQGQAIEALIQDWVNDEHDSLPRAILGGYGMGKTSLSLKISQLYARSMIDVTSARIPIYLRLADFVSETSVESLICKMFTSTFKVEHFNYERFIRLNNAGHLLLIFDGFDEMKHAMPFLAFKRIFKDICALAVPRSKVLVLGRPSAFTTDDERAQILHRKGFVGKLEIDELGMVDFREIEIANFTKDQSIEFIEKYFSYAQQITNTADSTLKSDDFRKKRLAELATIEYEELIQRPVHAKMLVDLSLSHTHPMGNITRYDLYDKFITMFYEREASKSARSDISIEDRRAFIQNVAYHFWKQGGRREFNLQEIKKIKLNVENTAVHKPTDDLYRELLIGNFLDRKEEEYYYFSHRSYQEFLVASIFSNNAKSVQQEFGEIAIYFNYEIIEFIKESGSEAFFLEQCKDALVEFTGPIDASVQDYLLKNWDQEIDSIDHVFENDHGMWGAYLNGCAVKQSDFPMMSNSIDKLNFHSNQFLAGIFGILVNEKLSFSNNTSDLVIAMVNLMHQFAYDVVENYALKGDKKQNQCAVGTFSERSVINVLLQACSPVINERQEILFLSTSYENLINAIKRELERTIEINPTGFRVNQEVNIPIIKLKEHLTGSLGKEDNYLSNIRTFWRKKPLYANFVSVQKTGDKEKKRSTLKFLNRPR